MLKVAEQSAVTPAEWSIGIDFGTAFSKAAATRIASEHGAALREVTPLPIGAAARWEKAFLVPSSMFLDRKRIHFGPRAVEKLTAADMDERELVRSFKTILGATDFEHALNFFPVPSVDPDRLFRLRDLIILYLAYLLALVESAGASTFGRDVVPTSRLRFSRPGWIPGRIAAAHEAMTSLFNQAHMVRERLGDALLADEGVAYEDALAALEQARSNPAAFANLDGGIYEASAVGLCHYSDANAPKCLLIVDVGAGTTDVAGLMRAPYQEDIRVVRTARRTIDIAGDNFDATLLNLILSKAKKLKTRAERSALWRSVVPRIRDLKEELFDKGVVEVEFRGTKIKCTARELQKQPAFKVAVEEIKRVYEKSLVELCQVGRRERVRTIGVVLAGGGARLPAIRAMVAKKRWLGFGMRVTHLPQTPVWAHDLGLTPELEASFAQLSAAFGAAISGPEQSDAKSAGQALAPQGGPS